MHATLIRRQIHRFADCQNKKPRDDQGKSSRGEDAGGAEGGGVRRQRLTCRSVAVIPAAIVITGAMAVVVAARVAVRAPYRRIVIVTRRTVVGRVAVVRGPVVRRSVIDRGRRVVRGVTTAVVAAAVAT